MEIDQRLALVRKFGTFTQAYSTAVQAELAHFWHADSYLAYQQQWGVFSWSRGLNAWWLNRFFYNLRGHADFKRRFYGREQQTYYASDCLFNDFRVIASLRMAGAL